MVLEGGLLKVSNCPELNCSVFAGYANPNCFSVSPTNFQAEQNIYNTAFSDLINGYGVNVTYFVNQYNTDTADNIYGEHPIQPFAPSQSLKMYVEISANAISLQKFGFSSDDEFTGYVHIDTFTTIFSSLSYHTPYNQRIEPKSGDVVAVSDMGNCRPGSRGPRYYEITERVDQDIPSINPMLGTYVYRLKGKRLEYSFETNLSGGESGNNQVFDSTFSGVLSSQLKAVSDPKSYIGDADTESATLVFTMSSNNTDIYGGYGY